MATTGQLGRRKLFLILTVLPCIWSLEVSIPEAEYKIAKGGDITLTCNFRPARPVTTALVLTWEAFPDNDAGAMKSVGTFFLNSPVDIAPAYEGRAVMEVDVNSQVSRLQLAKVTMQDSRRYQCSVLIPNDDEGTTAATTSLLVLEPPSVPVCEIQGKAEYYHDISLTCMSEEGSPKPAYEWRTFSVQNIPRQFPPKTTEEKGVLSLFNISREMSGFFICTSTNPIGSASCNLTLAVMPPSMNIGSTAAIIGGVLAGVVVLGIVVFCCCRKKGKTDDNAEGAPREMAFYDKDAPEAEPYTDDKSSSKTKEFNHSEGTYVAPQSDYSVAKSGQRFEEDQHSYNSGTEGHGGKGSDIDSQRYQDNPRDHSRGSRDRLDEQRERDGGSRDRLDDRRDQYSGSRDRYGGSRDRLEDGRDQHSESRDRYGGSRDRLDDGRDQYSESRDRYGGSRDHLDDQRGRYGGSRDRLEDRRDQYSESRDRYGGSRDRLDDQRGRYGGSRDRLDDHYRDGGDRPGRSGGSRDRLDYADD